MPVSGAPFGSTTAPPLGLTLLDIPADQLRRHFDALATILRGSQLGLVVRGAFPADLMTKVVTRLERGDCLLRRYDSPYFEGVCCGGIVVLAGNDLAPYLEQGQHFRAQTAPLFEGGYEYQPRIEEILGAMAGGRPVTVPLGPDGRPYMPSSIRGVTPGSGIDLHCENETVDFPGMRHLSTVIDKRQQLSFYVTLGVPDAGGKIAISSLQHATGAGRQLLDLDRVSGQTLAMVDSYPSVIPELNPGDLLIFDAGRHYHRVLPVVGKRIRWTMGGFVAFSRDHSQLHYWS